MKNRLELLRNRYWIVITELNQPFPSFLWSQRNKLLEEAEKIEIMIKEEAGK